MTLTKSFAELVQSRMAHDPDFAAALLREGIDVMPTGDVDTGKTVLRDYTKATVVFEKLGEATDTPAKSLIHMFGPRGNPHSLRPKPRLHRLVCRDFRAGGDHGAHHRLPRSQG